MSNKLAHLQMIQAVISQMAGNSFLLKGWSVTLVAALAALSAKDSRLGVMFLAYLPVIAFWVLDGYFLHQERRFRALYACVCDLAESSVNFKMTIPEPNDARSWPDAMLSRSVLVFHVALAVSILIAVIVVQLSAR